MEEVIEIQLLKLAHSVEASRIEAMTLSAMYNQSGNPAKGLHYCKVADGLRELSSTLRK